MSQAAFALGLFVTVLLSAGAGWLLRSWIADLEHDYRWWVEGCRHNIEERWSPRATEAAAGSEMGDSDAGHPAP